MPDIWLMTDERLGGGLIHAVQRLPVGSGIVFRHYTLDVDKRRRLFMRLKRIARRRQLIILLSGTEAMARRWRADGVYGKKRAHMLHAMPVHDRLELQKARQRKADILFISPLFATRSHPDATPLGESGFRKLAAKAGHAHVIALGGMNAIRARRLCAGKGHGWAAIDAFGI